MSGPEVGGAELSGAWSSGSEWILAFLACVYIALREALHRRRLDKQIAARREPS